MVVEHSNNKHLYFEEFGYVQSGSYYGKARPGYRLHFVLNGSGYFNGIEVSAKNYFLFPILLIIMVQTLKTFGSISG